MIRKRDIEEGSHLSDSPAGLIESTETSPDSISTPEHQLRPDNSWWAAILLALAMTVSEIGFLAAGVSQSAGVIHQPDFFLVVIWGIVLCTSVGAGGVGLSHVKSREWERLRRVEQQFWGSGDRGVNM